MTSENIVDYTESSEFEDDTSNSSQKIVDCDFNTDMLNGWMGGNLPANTQPPSDNEEQDNIPISSKREKLEGKSAEKKKKRSYSPAMMKTNQILS